MRIDENLLARVAVIREMLSRVECEDKEEYRILSHSQLAPL